MSWYMKMTNQKRNLTPYYHFNMPFQKGNKLSKGRPVGSKNKAADIQKVELQEMLFDMEDMKRDFQLLDAHKKFDIRMKAMSFFYSRPTTEIVLESKPWLKHKIIGPDGKDVSDEIKEKLYRKHGGNGTNNIELPLFYDRHDISLKS